MSKINSNYVKTEDFSIRNLEEFEDENLTQVEILYTESGKIKAKPFVKKTKLKHYKSPINQYPAYIGDKPNSGDSINHIYLDIKAIELNNYLLNFSRPFILDIRDRDLHMFTGDTDYISDRDDDIQVTNGWFYIYFGLTSENKLDIKISSEEPYRYNGQSEVRDVDYYFGNDPLYIYKNSIWYRCVSCVHMGTSDLFNDVNYYGIYPKMTVIDNKARFDAINLLITSNTNYQTIDISSFLPKNIITLKLFNYRGYLYSIDRENEIVYGTYTFCYSDSNLNFVTMDEIIPHELKFEFRSHGGNAIVYTEGFTIQ